MVSQKVYTLICFLTYKAAFQHFYLFFSFHIYIYICPHIVVGVIGITIEQCTNKKGGHEILGVKMQGWQLAALRRYFQKDLTLRTTCRTSAFPLTLTLSHKPK